MISEAVTNAITPIANAITPIANAITPIANALCELMVEQNNLYSKSALGSEGKSDRGETFRHDLLQSLGYNPRKRNRSIACMVTGESGNGACVVAAHIVPARSKIRYLLFIGLTPEDVSSSRNGLLLSKNIENAFDALQLSFIRGPVPDDSGAPMDGFTLKIWDDNCRNTPIWAGSDKLIGEYDGCIALQRHNPFKRALSHQAYSAFLHFRHELNAMVSPPSEYGSDNQSKYYKQRKLMKESVDRDMAEELDDANGEDHDDAGGAGIDDDERNP